MILLELKVTEETLLSSLQKHKQDKSIKINEVFTKNAVNNGDNFASDITRVIIRYNSKHDNAEKNLYVIIKSEGLSEAQQMLANDFHLFIIEINMYNNTLPKMHQFLGENLIAPACLYATLKPYGQIIMQDLSYLGYKMKDRHEGLDMKHSLKVMEKLATMHASSAVLYEKDPYSMNTYTKGLYINRKGNPITEDFIKRGFESLIKVLKTWPGYEIYSEKLEVIQNKVLDKSLNVGTPDPNGFNVLNHGDLWTNNIMFKYNKEGFPDDAKFIDFQLCVLASPAVDLQYFICTSLQLALGRQYTHKLLSHYHEHLAATLRKLNYPNEKIPTYTQIYQDFKQRGFYGVVTSACSLPMIKGATRHDATFEEFITPEESAFRKSCYTNQVYRKSMEVHLPYFEQNGYLE